MSNAQETHSLRCTWNAPPHWGRHECRGARSLISSEVKHRIAVRKRHSTAGVRGGGTSLECWTGFYRFCQVHSSASATEFIFVKIKKQNLMFFLLFVSFVRRTNAEVLDNPWKLPTSDRSASSFDQAALWSDDWLNNCYHFRVHTSLL